MSFWLSQKGSCVFGRWSTSFAPAGATSAMVNWLPPACTREPDQVQCWTRLPDLNPAPAGCRSGQVDREGERRTLLGGIAEAVLSSRRYAVMKDAARVRRKSQGRRPIVPAP
mgnify:CR=1 FL=1